MCHLRGVGGMETRRGATDEGGDGLHARVATEHYFHAVGNGLGLRKCASISQMHLHGETVAVGFGQHLDLQTGEEESAQGHRSYAQAEHNHWMTETMGQHFIVLILQLFEESVLSRLKSVGFLPFFHSFDENR